MLRFLVLSEKDDWTFIYAMIEIVGGTDSLKSMFLTTLATLIMHGQVPFDNSFIEMMKEFLFFSGTGVLKQMFQRSPFFGVARLRAMSQGVMRCGDREISLPSTLLHKILRTKSRPRRPGLRISIDGVWLDAQLAVRLLEVFVKHGDRNQLHLMLVISLFLNHCTVTFPQLSLSDQEVEEHLGLVSLLSLSGRSPGVDSFNSLGDFVTGLCTATTKTWHSIFRALSAAQQKTERLAGYIAESVRSSRKPLDEKMLETKQSWQRRWSCMSVDGAPWSCDQLTKTRDSFLCLGYVPMKLKMKRQLPLTSSQLWRPTLGESDFRAEIVRLTKNSSIIFGVRENHFKITYENKLAETIVFGSLVRILHRSRGNRPSAMELFTKSGRSLFIDFTEQSNSFNILADVRGLLPEDVFVQTTSYPENMAETQFVDAWLKNKISNFKYLFLLNQFSGRTFHDIAQYPVFPWVCSSSKPIVYRDLRKAVENPLLSKDEKSCFLAVGDAKKYVAPLFGFGESLTSIVGEFDSEIIPEFFCVPEALRGVELPSWARGSAIEFVYWHRKALESPVVSESLHHWIDLIWGYKHTACLPHQLFTRPHPLRVWRRWKLASFNQQISIQLPAQNLVVAFLTTDEPFSFAYSVESVDKDGSLVQTKVNLVEQPSPPLKTIAVAVGSHYTKYESGLAVLSKGSVIVQDASGVRTELEDANEIVCVNGDSNWVVVAHHQSTLGVYSGTKFLFWIPLFRDRVTCLAVSADFGMIATGTRDGFLVLSSLNRGTSVAVVDLKGWRPYDVLVTKEWGFVVVCSSRLERGRLEHRIAVYTVNGEVVRTAQLEGKVAVAATWGSAAGFDYMIVAEEGKFRYCEVFYLEFVQVKGYEWSAPIVALRYQPKELGVVVVHESGTLVWLPLVVDMDMFDH
jgi:hypothetical protein